MKHMAILTDVTRCIGCEECVAACQKTNQTGQDATYRWQRDANELSSTRWTTLARAPQGRYVRELCRHCLDPACAAACPVGALSKSAEGPVIYDPDICMGCRYCMVACPFRMTRYEWDSATPRIRKCILCYDKIKAGELDQPACTKACPNETTLFGDREALIEQAWQRIRTNPDRYIHHVWGEHEVGGTSMLYISDVDLRTAGWPSYLDGDARPELARMVLHKTVFPTFFSVAAVMAGTYWIIERRQRLGPGGPESGGEEATAEPGETGEAGE
jgi:formate dehydrogenase iron-sulfur subunit